MLLSTVGVGTLLFSAAVRASEHNTGLVPGSQDGSTDHVLDHLELADCYAARSVCKQWLTQINRRFCEQLINGAAPEENEFGEGIIDCDDIDEMKDLIDQARSKRVCFTPRMCGKLIRFRQMTTMKPSTGTETLRPKLVCSLPKNLRNQDIKFLEYAAVMSEDGSLIAYVKGRLAAVNIKTGHITELPPSKEARFVNDQMIALFNHDDRLGLFDLRQNKKVDIGEIPVYGPVDWSVSESDSGLRTIFCQKRSNEIAFFKFDSILKKWEEKKIGSSKSEESYSEDFSQFLSEDGSIMVAYEEIDDCTLLNIVDTKSESITTTVLLPFRDFRQMKLTNRGAYFYTNCKSGLLVDLKTGGWVRLVEPGQLYKFSWLSDTLFMVDPFLSRDVCKHIRCIQDPFSDLVSFSTIMENMSGEMEFHSGRYIDVFYPVAKDLLHSERSFFRIEENTD